MSKYLSKIYEKIRVALPGGENYILSEISRGGGTVGKNIKLYSRTGITIDMTRPWLITIGDGTMITKGVVILTHDYSKAVLQKVYGDNIGEGAETIIGDNCFVGMNSVILMGAHIGNNVIVGAGSVVHGTIPNNVVIAGNPAKVICSLEEHYEKRKQRTADEAVNCAKRFYNAVGRKPTQYEMRYFKSLFTDENLELQKWESFEEYLMYSGLEK